MGREWTACGFGCAHGSAPGFSGCSSSPAFRAFHQSTIPAPPRTGLTGGAGAGTGSGGLWVSSGSSSPWGGDVAEALQQRSRAEVHGVSSFRGAGRGRRPAGPGQVRRRPCGGRPCAGRRPRARGQDADPVEQQLAVLDRAPATATTRMTGQSRAGRRCRPRAAARPGDR